MRYEVEITAVVYVEAEDEDEAKERAEDQAYWDDGEARLIAAKTVAPDEED